MLFHSLEFAFFFALAFFGHWMLAERRRLHTYFLSAMSVWFYAAWNAWYILLVVVSTVIDFVASERIHASDRPKVRKGWLLASLIGNLGLLGTFKYYNFFVDSIQQLTGFVGMPISLPLLNVLLPVGISFYTFQSMSYTIDVYRRKIEPARGFMELFLYVVFFPQLVAGPIVRAADFLPQLRRAPTLDPTDVGSGLFRIVRGYVKKIVIADFLGRTLVDPTFLGYEEASSFFLLLSVWGFMFQIYGDFAGYSDVAIGLARLMGYHFPENFRSPFQSTSTRELFGRWHISLSSWLRDYLFRPLGGYRKGSFRSYLNLFLTMFLAGLWHGASWKFAVFGIYSGLTLLQRPFKKGEVPSRVRVWFWRIVCFQIAGVGFMIFRAPSVKVAATVFWRIVTGIVSMETLRSLAAFLTDPAWRGTLLVLLFAVVTHLVPDEVKDALERRFGEIPWFVSVPVAATGLGLVMVLYNAQTPFIYFQF